MHAAKPSNKRLSTALHITCGFAVYIPYKTCWPQTPVMTAHKKAQNAAVPAHTLQPFIELQAL